MEKSRFEDDTALHANRLFVSECRLCDLLCVGCTDASRGYPRAVYLRGTSYRTPLRVLLFPGTSFLQALYKEKQSFEVNYTKSPRE